MHPHVSGGNVGFQPDIEQEALRVFPYLADLAKSGSNGVYTSLIQVFCNI